MIMMVHDDNGDNGDDDDDDNDDDNCNDDDGVLLSGGARGPGVFFIIPCVDVYQKIDMRTQTYDVPPQEVAIIKRKQ